MNRIYYDFCATEQGPLLLAITQQGLIHVDFCLGESPRQPQDDWILDPLRLAPYRRQFEEYFAGRRKRFDLPLATQGTPFQQQVWRALLSVPYGTTATYGEIARWIENPKAVRAVGMANRYNPLAIVVPCHRIIGSNGRLVGYAGGLEIKKWLLDLERRNR